MPDAFDLCGYVDGTDYDETLAMVTKMLTKHMKIAGLMGLFFFWMPHESTAQDVCPVLPPASGFVWTHSKGPDFDVCRASVLGSEDLAFGIYLGNHPSFRPERHDRVGKSKVAGRRVSWYRSENDAAGEEFSRQTLVVLHRRTGYVAHVWVNAASEQELADRLSILQRIAFRE